MQLEFRPDFEAVRQRWTAFWNGQSKRPMVYLELPKPGVEEVRHPPYLAGRDGNFTPIIDQMLRYCETHQFLADSLPTFVLEWGPDTFGAYLGAGLTFSTGTSWAVPVIEDWDTYQIKFDRNNHWWRLTEDLVHEMRRRCEGKFLINLPCIVANLDALAALRGSEKLLMDLVMCPEKVHRALDQVCIAQAEVLKAYAELLDFDTWGSINNSLMYSPGWTTRPQCDISCMISAGMFRDFVQPCLKREVENMNGVEYHLDGPDAAQHIEALCEIEKLDVVGWQPTKGTDKATPETLAWREEQFKKIDNLGKGMTRFWPEKDQLKQWWRQYKTRQLYCFVRISSKSEAEDFLAELETIQKDDPCDSR